MASYNKEFFRCDLEKCIIELKRAASAQLPYREWYRDQQMKARIEGREAQYLRELEERRRREQLAREERARRERQEAAAARAEWERKEKERVERDRQRREKENAGCLWLGGIVLLGLWLGTEERSFWPLVISIIIGFWVYNNFTKNEDSTTTNYHRDTTYMGDYSARNVSPQRTNGTSSQKNVLNSESNAIDVLYPLVMFILCAVGTITILYAFVKE